MIRSTRKIPTTAIEQARRAIRNAPEYLAKEVTKVQAIGELIPDIQQMLTKGYDCGAVATLLSEHGIAVTGVTLKSYLQQAKGPGGKKARRKRGETEGAPGGGGEGARKASSRGEKSRTEGAPTLPDRVAAAVPSMAPAKQTSVEPPRTTPLRQEATVRRSAFVPEEDDDNI